MQNTCAYCFFLGFIIDKISLFPFILGIGIGIILTDNSNKIDSIKNIAIESLKKFKTKK